MSTHSRFERWLVLVCVLGVLATAGPLLWCWRELPDPVARHWSLRGAPDGASSKLTTLLALPTLALMPALLSWRGTRRSSEPLAAPRLLAVLTFSSLVAILVTGCVIVLNWGRVSWRAAASPSPGPLAAGLLACGVVSALVYRIAERALPAGAPAADAEPATFRLEPDERVFWRGSAHNRWLFAVVLLLVLAALFTLQRPGGAFAAELLGALALMPFTRVEVTITARMLCIRYGVFGWPRQRFELSRIVRARAIEVLPLAHGGWGYRGSVRVFGRAALVVRRGRALSLELTRGQRFTVTVDDPETASRLINGLVEREGRAHAS